MLQRTRYLPYLFSFFFLFSVVSSVHAEIIVALVSGDVQFRQTAEDAWKAVKVTQSLNPGVEVRTSQDAKLVLKLNQESEVRVAPDSHLKINLPTQMKQQKFDLQLSLGRAWAKVQKTLTLGTRVILRTAHASIKIQGTSYAASATPEKTELHVFSGKVQVENAPVDGPTLIDSQAPKEISGPQEIAPPREVTKQEWQMIVKSFQTISVGKGGAPSQPQRFTLESIQDEWILWNISQDQSPK